MFEAHSINAEHKDLIHDIAYDFYGQRMATCSSDQFVKVRFLQSLIVFVLWTISIVVIYKNNKFM